MGTKDAQPVLIAGGGIGGLATALGLAQKGIRSILLEKASHLGEIGAGIQLGPNAFHAFNYLGVGEAARGMAVYIDQLRLMDALTAEEITHVDLRDAFRARFGNPYAVVHRGDLHGVFLRACQAHELIELRVSSEVVGYDQDGSSVSARLANSEDVTGRLLIGADGLWSHHGCTKIPGNCRVCALRVTPGVTEADHARSPWSGFCPRAGCRIPARGE